MWLLKQIMYGTEKLQLVSHWLREICNFFLILDSQLVRRGVVAEGQEFTAMMRVWNLWKSHRHFFKKNLGMKNSQCEALGPMPSNGTGAEGPSVLSSQIIASSLSVS